MTLYYVNTGSGPNTHDGDSLRTAFNKINANFTQISTGSLGAVLIQSPSVPQGYGPGTLWYDTESGRTYVFYNGSWVDANPSSNQNSSKVSVSLYNPDTQLASNTVTNVSTINFDSLADFSVTSQGNGGVLIGMNSTFKYIQIAGQPTLAAQGVDTLTLVAGTGTQLITSNAGLKNQQTITFISTGSGAGSSLPTTSTAGYLYTNGSGIFSWSSLSASTLTNGTASFGLNSDGSVTFNNGTKQSTAYATPATDSSNASRSLVFLNGTALQYNSGLYYNPSARQLGKMASLIFYDNSVQSTAWPGTTSTLVTSNGGTTSTLRLTTTTLLLSTGTITFPDLSVQRVAYTGTVEYSKLTGVPVVTTSSLNNNGFIAALTTSGTFTLQGPLIIQNSGTSVFSISTGTSSTVLASLSTVSGVTIQTKSTSSNYNWTFNNNGTVTYPDGTTQYTAGRNIYDYIFSGTQKLSIMSNGVVRFPDGTNQTTAFVGTATSLQNSGYLLRPVAVPADIQYGSPSDRVGDIAFDQNFLYYCIAPYGSKSYVTAAYQGSPAATDAIVILQSYTNGRIPQPYWTFQKQGNSTIYIVTSIQTATIGQDAVYILYSTGAGIIYNQNDTFYVTNTSSDMPNWARTAITTVGMVTSLTDFVNPSVVVSNNVINVQWNPVVLFNQNYLQLNISAKSGTISQVSYTATATGGGTTAVFTGFLPSLTATLVQIGSTTATPGDSITILLTSYTSRFSYRITAIVGQNLINNFIGIEQLL
jgi:hypothetical protein